MKRTPRDTDHSARLITRRGLVLGGVQLGVLGVLGTRMHQLQVKQASEYRLLADENRINMHLLAPARGLIYDRNGVVIAGNEQNYRIAIVREVAGDVDEVVDRLRRIVRLDPDELARAVAEVKRRSPFVPVTLADQLSWEDIAEVAVNAPALPGITPEVGLSRSYPMGSDFAHVLGYVGAVSDYDLSRIDDKDPLLQIPKFQIGKVGVERKMEAALRGGAGSRRIEINATGRVMRELERQEGDPGTDVQLTLDHGLQNFAMARMQYESAAAVVMDVTNGDILAITSTPTFDPNKFVHGISGADYRTLTESKYRPLADKSVQGTYPPGSTFKMMVALAGLEHGIIQPSDTTRCRGYTELGNRKFHCWKRGGHGNVDLETSLRRSCDVYYYELAREVGIDRIAEMARRFGFDDAFNLPMSAVSRGIMPDKTWLAQRYSQDWRVGDTLNAAIGQGYVLATPLQLAVMTARIANGTGVEPRLVKSVASAEVPLETARSLRVNENHLRLVRDGMFGVVNRSGGTAGRSRVALPELTMAGKTGTSQVRSISAAERAQGVTSNADLPWERRDHALFVGYAPYEDPKYAVSIVVEHGGGGSVAAAPIARDLMLYALYGGMPQLEAYPSNQQREAGERLNALPLRQRIEGAPVKSRA